MPVSSFAHKFSYYNNEIIDQINQEKTAFNNQKETINAATSILPTS